METDKLDTNRNKNMANAIRVLTMDAVQKANSGHPGMPMGMADMATVLFSKFLKFDPSMPDWPNRDRFILSAGHGSMLLYSCMYLLGYEDITIDEIHNFRQLNAKTAGHPEYGHAKGIETTTGPLGQGIANAVGMAIAERIMAAEFGNEVVNHYTYVIAGDGCLMEGISHEAISLAGHLGLDKLIVLFDDNNISIDGELNLAESGDQIKRFNAAGWNTISIDGHDHEAIATAIETAQKTSGKPTLIACKTTIGFGAPNKEGTSGVHGSPLGEDEIIKTKQILNWEDTTPFNIPSEVLDDWRIAGLRGKKDRKEWEKTFEAQPSEKRGEFLRRKSMELPVDIISKINEYKEKITNEKPNIATRNASQNVLEVINEYIPETIGGSADLTGSNNTKTSQMQAITPEDFSGRYIHYGVREHGMAAAMNGIALYGGLIPYGGTFLVFSDYSRPSIRLAALMKQRVIHVLTHDSIGLGEDGPTHQPVEHLASLRAIPNLNVFRPADAVETAECWQLAIEAKETPSSLALTRQKLPLLRKEYTEENKCSRGAYEISTASGDPDITIYASGSEVEVAIEASQKLEELGHSTRVISVPCFELFAQQSDSYKEHILGRSKVKIAVEAAIKMGWEQFIGINGIFIGMSGFGASAPYKELYKYFGITSNNIVEKAIAKIATIKEIN